MVWVKWKIHLLRTHFPFISKHPILIYIKYKLIWLSYRRGRNKAFSYPLLLSYIKTFSDTKTLKYRMRCIEEGFFYICKIQYIHWNILWSISQADVLHLYIYIYKICIFLSFRTHSKFIIIFKSPHFAFTFSVFVVVVVVYIKNDQPPLEICWTNIEMEIRVENSVEMENFKIFFLFIENFYVF